MPVSAADIADQLMLGRYRVLEERGKGGFGAVYVCWDPRLMRRVAIKAIPLRAAEVEGYPAFDQASHLALLRAALSETRTASMLPHPNIVAVLDFDYDDDNAYIVMEYVEGASLAELLDATDDGLLTGDEAAAVAESVCDALQFAHDNGVLHLDIKPDNILVDMSGRVKLADFGMAALSSATGYAGARGGTVGYMPPEQVDGGRVDVRTDLFAFACVMYEALTGVRPFAADGVAASRRLVERGAADPCALNGDVPPQVADALLDALSPYPDERPSSADELGERLVAGLGRPKAGRKSLASFVADVLDDSTPDEEDGGPDGAWGDAAGENLGGGAAGAPERGGFGVFAALADLFGRHAEADGAHGPDADKATKTGEAGKAAKAGKAHGSAAPAPRRTLGERVRDDLADGRGPVSRLAPRVGAWVPRALGALLAALVVALAVATLFPAPATSADLAAGVPDSLAALPAGVSTPALVAGLAVLALALAVPVLGGALALAALAAAACASGLWLAGAALLGVGGAWWALVARAFPVGSCGTLAGAGTLPAAPQLAGWLLPAGPAALSALTGFLATGTLACLAGAASLDAYTLAGFAAPSAGRAVRCFAQLVSSAPFWICGAGWVAAAAVMGGLCHGGSKARCYLGCLLSGVTLLAFGLVASRMENGGSWQPASPGMLATAACSTILVALCVFLLGTPSGLGADGRRRGADRRR